MNLREVRQAAKQHIWHPSVVEMSNYILATIDPSPDLPITAEWLREEWGGNITQHGVTIFAKDIGRECLLFDTPKGWEVSGEDDYYWPIHLTTRQQFTDLARCLGIPRRPSKSEPGCTCLDSPNMLYAPCSYCEQRRKDGVK